jgi:hypothetical protein
LRAPTLNEKRRRDREDDKKARTGTHAPV